MLQSLVYLDSKLADNDSYISNLAINPELSNFTYTKHFHMTTLFMKNDPNRMKSKYYQQFTEGKQVNMRIGCIVIVPDKIITSLAWIDEQGIGSENEYPHVTLMTGTWKPFQSLDILKALFNQKYGVLSDVYQKFKNNQLKSDYAETVSVMIKNTQETVYLVCMKELSVTGTMTRFDS